MNLSSTHIISVIAGLALLAFGRRLFWFFVGVVGFAAGLSLAQDQFHLQSTAAVIAVSLLAGLIGALLALVLQKLAIGVAGFAAGAYLAGELLKALGHPSYVWIGFLVGGVLGAILLITVFEWALIVLSSLVGAALVSDGLARPDNALLIFFVFFFLGILIQRFNKGPERPRDRPRPDK